MISRPEFLLFAVTAVSRFNLVCGSALAQEVRPVTSPSSAAARELPADVLIKLDQIEDFALRFDHPGFYALLRYVNRSGEAPGSRFAATDVEDWRTVLEKPGEFRGRAITVEGTVGRSSSWRPTTAETSDIGLVWQWELERADQPVACTVILTEDVGDVPLGAKVRVTGYFAMVRQYYTRQNRVAPALLIVAQGPSSISRVAFNSLPTGTAGTWGIGGVCAALLAGVVAWRVLRRRDTARTDLHTLRPEHAAPVNLSSEIAEWARTPPDASGAEREEPRC